MTEIEVFYDSTDQFIIQCEDQELVMSREEAEWLFTDLGHMLKAHDHDLQERLGNVQEDN